MALSITSGAYSTGLISYFTHRDLFPSLMKVWRQGTVSRNCCANESIQFVQDSELSGEISEPFILLGLLANYNKFEFQNPYRLRLDDFVNDVAIKKTVQCVGNTCRDLRDRYVAVQDDTPEAWSIGTALSYVGLGALTGSRPASPAPSPEEAQSLFTTLYVTSQFQLMKIKLTITAGLVRMPPFSFPPMTSQTQTNCSAST